MFNSLIAETGQMLEPSKEVAAWSLCMKWVFSSMFPIVPADKNLSTIRRLSFVSSALYTKHMPLRRIFQKYCNEKLFYQS